MSSILELVSGPLRFAAIAAIVPFFANFTIVNNGVYRDYVAIGAGGLAILLSVLAFSTALPNERKGTRLGILIAVLALGAVQLSRGFGLLAT